MQKNEIIEMYKKKCKMQNEKITKMKKMQRHQLIYGCKKYMWMKDAMNIYVDEECKNERMNIHVYLYIYIYVILH